MDPNERRKDFSERDMSLTDPSLPDELPQIRETIKQTAERIFNNLATLQAIIERHEETIQKRWIKKSKPKRREILLSAWPAMASDHRPDLVLMRRHQPGQKFQGEERDAFLMPWINQHDLSKNEPMLLMLNSRARSPPHAFAQRDLQPSMFGISKGAIPLGRYLGGYVMEFRDRTSPDTYGEIVEGERVGGDPRFGCGCCNPGDGLRTLEIQDRVYQFLLEVTKSVLHDIPPASLAGPQYPVQPEPPLPSANSRDDGMVFLAATNLEASYLAPGKTDFARLEMLLEARASEAEDELWALREDPQSFATAVSHFINHRPEFVPDTSAKLHPWTEPAGFGAFLGRMPPSLRHSGINSFQDFLRSICITSGIIAVEFWAELRRKVGRVVELEAQQFDGKNIAPDDPLPEEFTMALYKLHDAICRSISQRIEVFRQAAWASPSIRPYVRRATAQATGDFVPVSMPPKHISEFCAILGGLFSKDDLETTGHLAGVQSLMDEYEQFCSTPKNLEAVSPHVANEISNLALLSECLRQLQLFQPWASAVGDEMKKPHISKELKTDFNIQMQALQPCQMYFMSVPMCKTASKIISMDYPVSKRRTKEHVEAMRAAESTLDGLWEQIVTGLTRSGAPPRCSKRVLLGRNPVRTTEWVEPPKRKPGKTAVSGRIESAAQSFGGLQVTKEKNKVQPPTSKTKPKTRGTPRPELEPTAEGFLEQPAESKTQHIVKVDKRSLKVFHTLFFVPSASAQPGGVPWMEFLHAMHKAGFLSEKLYGSVWQFTPSTTATDRIGGDSGGKKRSILFHEPHPHSKIPFQHARRFGWRLHKAYEWSGETFVLEQE